MERTEKRDQDLYMEAESELKNIPKDIRYTDGLSEKMLSAIDGIMAF